MNNLSCWNRTLPFADLHPIKWQYDPLIVVLGNIGMALSFLFVWVFLAHNPSGKGGHDHH